MPSVPPAASVPVAKTACVFVAAQFRQRHLTHHGGGRERGAADGAEGGAAADRRHGKTAAEMADPSRGCPEQGGGDAGAGSEMAHHQEQRDDRKVGRR